MTDLRYLPLRPSLFPELVTKDSGPMSFPFRLGILPKRFVRKSEDLEDEHAVGKSCPKLFATVFAG